MQLQFRLVYNNNGTMAAIDWELPTQEKPKLKQH